MLRRLLAVVLLLAAAPAAAGERIEQLLQAMTLREKLGQLDLRSADLARTGPELRSDYRSAVRQGIVGGLFNAYGAEFTRRLQEIAVHETRLGIPLLFAFDVVHGHRTVFPIPLAEAASFDVALAERTARIAAIEATAEGVSWTFAPMLDVSRDPRWGRIAEGPGEDPWWGAQLAAAKIRGFQGSDLTAPDTLAATAKHLGGYGAPEGGRDYNTAEVSERTLREVYLPPFRAAVNAGVSAIMPAFNDIAGVPGTANRALLDGVVRGDWGFGGVIVSDYHAVPELVVHGVAADPAEAATLALGAGVDVDMESDAFARGLPRALRSGRAKLAAVDAAVRRVLTLKERLGLFDDPFRYSNPTREAEVRRAAHRAEARDAARRSIVLLKNAGGLLPIARDIDTIAVIGPLADAAEEMLGPWAAAGDPEAAVSLLDGIRAAASPTTRVLHAPGTAIAGGTRAGFDAALEAAREADVVVLCLGESAAMSGEGASRASLTLPGRQQELADAVIATGKPVVVTLTGGRPLAVPDLAASATALLATWFLGHEAGHALADVLFGEWNPSARLPVTFPRHPGQVPLYYGHRPTGRPAGSGRYTSKYQDTLSGPLYPFGWGESYTSFRYGAPRLGARRLGRDGTLEVAVDVTNGGSRAGETTVQLYVHDSVASVARPVLELRGIAKLWLEPGQTATARLALRATEFAFLRADGTVGVEPGRIDVLVGPNSVELQATHFTLDE